MTQDRHILTFGNLAEETPGALTWDHLMAESMGRRACSLPVQDLALISPQANGSQIGVSTLDLSPELWIQTQHLHLTIIHCQFKLNMLEIRHWTISPSPSPFLGLDPGPEGDLPSWVQMRATTLGDTRPTTWKILNPKMTS